MLAAIILPWVGGPLPGYVAYTCASMALNRVETARLVLIFEASASWSVPWSCTAGGGVEVHEVCDGCVASLHAQRMTEASGSRVWHVEALLARLLKRAPQVLAEFKPTWGIVFADYIKQFSHWTYTDTDVVFGALDAFTSSEYDIETWSFEGDAGRLFLRGQWTLHRNVYHVNSLWTHCSHFTDRLEANLRYKLDFFERGAYGGDKKRERAASDARARQSDTNGCDATLAKFISAEACYSCVVFRSNLTKRIVPNLLTDHSDRPVVWTPSSGLSRCLGDKGTCDPPRARRPPSSRSPMQNATYVSRAARLVHDCFDMQWICRSSPAAAMHVALPPMYDPRTSLGPSDVVVVDATKPLVLVGRIVNHTLRSAPVFHFRKWVDYGTFDVPQLAPDSLSTGFVFHKSGIRNLRVQRRKGPHSRVLLAGHSKGDSRRSPSSYL